MTAASLPTLPFEQPNPLNIAPLLRVLQVERPVTRVRTETGHEAWLVTRYDDVHNLLNDRRLGWSHPDPQNAPRCSNSILFGGPAGIYETEFSDLAARRALLTPFFSAVRMRELRPRVESLVDQLLGEIAEKTPPVDLHQALAFPLPVLVICELLGVPYEDRKQFTNWVTEMASLHDRERQNAGQDQLIAYMGELVALKRANPADDVLSHLLAGGKVPDERVAFLGAMLLFAGHEQTSVRIAVGTLLLLTHPDQRKALVSDPDLATSAVEEILRRADTQSAGLHIRYARETIELGDVTIKAGEAVLLSGGAADHDQSTFPEPDRFAIDRQPNPHIAFGHGPRYCLGAPLARLELQAVFARLFARFPTLRLAVPLEELRSRSDIATGGVFEFPVTW